MSKCSLPPLTPVIMEELMRVQADENMREFYRSGNAEHGNLMLVGFSNEDLEIFLNKYGFFFEPRTKSAVNPVTGLLAHVIRSEKDLVGRVFNAKTTVLYGSEYLTPHMRELILSRIR